MLALLQSLHVPDAPNVQHSPDGEGIELRTFQPRFQPEQKEETTRSSKLNSGDITILGLQELLNNYWLEIDGLILVSFLSVRARQIASNGRYWRSAIRATFPMHPFEVSRRAQFVCPFVRSFVCGLLLLCVCLRVFVAVHIITHIHTPHNNLFYATWLCFLSLFVYRKFL